MIKSAIIQEHIIEFLSDGEAYSVQEIKAYLAKVNIGEYSEGQFAGSLNTLQRNGTIEKTERGIYSLHQKDEEDKNMKTCFVVSPIGDEKSEIRKNADQLFKYIIEPVCKSCGFTAKRVDQMNDVDSITEKILDSLERADLVIADISGHNPNVFYEMGFRRRTNKPIIHLRKQGESLPFDVHDIRAFDYDLTDLDNVASLKDRLEKTINSFLFSSADNDSNNVNNLAQESITPIILPVLYQIVDAISELHGEVKNNNSSTLETIIRTLQAEQIQPKMSQQDALIAQLLPSMLQNPDMMEQFIKLGERIPQQNSKKQRR